MSAITIDGPLARVTFDHFDLDSYELFLACKKLPESSVSYDWTRDTYEVSTPARFAALLGVPDAVPAVERLPLADHLFDYQAWIVTRALEALRFAIWADTGLGKSPMLLEWCRQVAHLTGARVLILEPLAVIPQLIEEARRFYGAGLPIERLESRERLIGWLKDPGAGVGITNPEKFIAGQVGELRLLGGLAFDESSLLKTGGGVIKWNIIHSAKGIQYKLSCTATPAPNDTMEYASQAAFLEKLRTEGEILWTYFARDKFGIWSVKPHARAAFYRFMASWSIYLRNPAHFGWRDILATLPAPEIREYPVPMTPEQETEMYRILAKGGKGLFGDDRLGIKERGKLSQVAKGFIYEQQGGKRVARPIESLKPGKVYDLVIADVMEGRQVLVWTVFDEESDILFDLMEVDLDGEDGATVAVLHGSMSEEARADVLERFRRGEVTVLISKASLIGYGLNFQFCRSMVFSGFDDSAERFYQSVRRCYRFGQSETVRVHIPYIRELEGLMWGNVQQKLRRFDAETAIQEEQYRKVLQAGEGAA